MLLGMGLLRGGDLFARIHALPPGDDDAVTVEVTKVPWVSEINAAILGHLKSCSHEASKKIQEWCRDEVD